jgi:kynurenine formamidase
MVRRRALVAAPRVSEIMHMAKPATDYSQKEDIMSVITRASVLGFALVIGAAVLSSCASDGGRAAGVKAKPLYLDLTHPIPTFESLAEKPGEPNLSKPHGDSKAIPSFFMQAVLQTSVNPTGVRQGHFYRGYLTIAEHHGTHIDAPSHYVNARETTEAGAVPVKFQHDLTLQDLIGPVVYIDISQRVQTALKKNGGTPTPDKSVMDFSEASSNNVTAQDIVAVADKLQNGSWIVVNTGWSRFFSDPDLAISLYINGWNFPGVSRAALDKLIELEDQKNIRINGIAIDNLGIDSGEGERGIDDQFTNSFHSHVRGLQRGWKFVENAANLGALASAGPDNCTLVVGALPHVRGSGSPARVIAICES